MSSNQKSQVETTSLNTNADEGAAKRKKTRPNQRKRRQIAILKAKLKETETASLTGDTDKKDVHLILNTSLTTKSSPSSHYAPTNSLKSTPTSNNSINVAKKQDSAQLKSTKKDIPNKPKSAVVISNQKHSNILLEAITNSNSKATKAPNSKPVDKQELNTKPLQTTTNSQNNKPNKSLQQKNYTDSEKQTVQATLNMSANPTSIIPPTAGKTREEIMAEREAKKLAKQAKKAKPLATTDSQIILTEAASTSHLPPAAAVAASLQQQEVKAAATSSNYLTVDNLVGVEKTREQIKAERDAKKKAKQAQKVAKAAAVPELTTLLENAKITENSATPTQDGKAQLPDQQETEKKKPTLSKAERRAIQEAQRAAKAQALAQKNKPTTQTKSTSSIVKPTNQSTTPDKVALKSSPKSATSSSPSKTVSPLTKSQRNNDCKVRLFNHLEKARHDVSLFLNNPHIHPSIARLGVQYAQRTVVGSNARCIAFLNALKMVIRDFETPPKKEFTRSLETTITNSVEHLQKCRPLAVSVSNAYKHIKHVLTQLSTDQTESDLKENLCRFIDTYIENQIGKAAEAISYSVQEKISDGDIILTFGCSSLITYIFEEAQRRRVNFRVIIVDSRPFCEGQELLRRLTVKEIPCSYVLINAISFVMPDATKVLLGAHALLANGYVMARTGTAQVALVAHSFNVPVLVCCETHKFSERSQTDAIVYNELGNPDDLIRSDKCSLTNWQMKGKMVPLNLMYDITPPELVTAVVTEVSILPCTSVPVILRIKPTEIGY